MNGVWLQVLLVMVGGSLLKYVIPLPVAWVVIDLAVLGIAYLLLRRYPFVDFKSSMLFLGGLTVVNILTDLGFINGFVGTLLILAVLAWMFFRNGGGGGDWRRKRQPLRYKWHK
ncbi:MAG: hypothetical protein AAGU23_07435 [Bacillota bacterium]